MAVTDTASPYLTDAGWKQVPDSDNPLLWRDPETGRRVPQGVAAALQQERDLAAARAPRPVAWEYVRWHKVGEADDLAASLSSGWQPFAEEYGWVSLRRPKRTA